MNRETQNVLLLLVGGAIVKITVDGTYLRYVKPTLAPLLLAAGIVTVILALSAIVRDIRAGSAESERGSRPHWALVVPVAVILFVAPPALGATSVGVSSQDRVTRAQAPTKITFPPLPGGATPEITLIDLAQRAARDSTGSLDGREVSVSGFVVGTSNGGAPRLAGDTGTLDLARIVITCCVADARTIRVHLQGRPADLPDDLPDGTWVQVTGTTITDSATGDTAYTPTLRVSSLTRIPAPANPYQY